MTDGTNRKNGKMVLFGIALVMMVVLGFALALAAFLCRDARKFTFCYRDKNCLPGGNGPDNNASLVSSLHDFFAIAGLLVAKSSSVSLCSGVRAMATISFARLAFVLQPILASALLVKARSLFSFLAVAAAFGQYNGLSHDVDLPKRFASGQGRSGSQLPFGPFLL